MVRPNELVKGMLYTLKESGAFPENTNFIGYEPDIDSESIKLPLVQVTMLEKVDVNESNTDFIGFRTDDDGNDVGRVYETLYRQEFDISVWTAHDSSYSAREWGDTVRTELYEHTTSGPNNPLVHPETKKPLDEVWRFVLLSSEHTNDLTTSPTLRRWTETVSISASEQYLTDEDPIDSVDFNDEVTEVSGEIEISSGDTK